MCLKKLIFSNCVCITFCIVYVPVNSNTAHCPPHPGHLTGVLLRTVENLTQNEAHQVGHLTVVSKRWSASQAKGSRNSFILHVHCIYESLLLYIHCFVGAFENLWKSPLNVGSLATCLEMKKPPYDSFPRLKGVKVVSSAIFNFWINGFTNGKIFE